MKDFLLAVGLFLSANIVFAQDFKLYEKQEFQSDSGQTLLYRILFPENYDKTKKYPLLLFLHGAGERGDNNQNQLVHGAKLFLADSNRKKFPCIVIFPQCPANNFWNCGKLDFSHSPLEIDFNYTTNPELWPLHAAVGLVRKIAAEEAVDQSRIYVAGLSMGGMGAFEAVYRYPKLFAAAIPICGGGDSLHYDKRVRNTSFRIFHGDHDGAVDVNESRRMVKRLRQLKVHVKYSEYPGVDHNSWDNAFAEPDFLSWLFKQNKK